MHAGCLQRRSHGGRRNLTATKHGRCTGRRCDWDVWLLQVEVSCNVGRAGIVAGCKASTINR